MNDDRKIIIQLIEIKFRGFSQYLLCLQKLFLVILRTLHVQMFIVASACEKMRIYAISGRIIEIEQMIQVLFFATRQIYRIEFGLEFGTGLIALI